MRALFSTSGGLGCETSAMSETSEVSKSLFISLRVGCLASLRARSAKCVELLTNDGCGQRPSESSASFDHGSASLRTRQLSLLWREGQPSTELFQDWSRSGMICGGRLYLLPPLVQDICENVSSSLLPTPTAARIGNEVNQVKSLEPCRIERPNKLGQFLALHLVPTPTARDWKDTSGMNLEGREERLRDDQLPRRIFHRSTSPIPSGSRLNPQFALWLMGFPVDWLKPLYDAWATRLSRKSRKSSSAKSRR